jgi:S1-C subfamily serine protease
VGVIQTTAPITYGSSGGGLFDEDGRVIGLTSGGVGGGGNLNFAVSMDEALDLLDRSR